MILAQVQPVEAIEVVEVPLVLSQEQPAVTYAAPTTYATPRTYGASVAEVDRVDALGRVVERDFVGGGYVPTTYAAPTETPQADTRRTTTPTVSGSDLYGQPTDSDKCERVAESVLEKH